MCFCTEAYEELLQIFRIQGQQLHRSGDTAFPFEILHKTTSATFWARAMWVDLAQNSEIANQRRFCTDPTTIQYYEENRTAVDSWPRHAPCFV